jgi:hypothetical protein
MHDTRQPNGKQSSALDKAGEFATYITALVTGALVFSAELLKKDYNLAGASRGFVFGCWVCLALAALCGLAVLARIPYMIAEGSEDLEDRFLKYPLRGQQLFFLIGILTLGVALVLALWASPSSPADGQKPVAGVENKNAGVDGKFTILSSAPHVVGKGRPHQHTFLLDRETGSIWDLVCDSENNARFRKVEVEGLHP